MTSRSPRIGWDRVLRRLLPGWFLTAWGREVTDLLRAEEAVARSRGHAALLRFRLATTVDLVRAAWQTRHHGGVGLPGDVRLALRLFRRSPAYTCVVLLSLAIGVALSATAFSVLDPAISRPLPFPHADQLWTLRVATMQGETQLTRVPSYGQFRAWQNEAEFITSSAEAMVAYQRRWQQQEAPGGVEDPFAEVLVQTVSPGFFPLLGAHTSLGRALTIDDHRAGAPAVAVVGHGFWQRQLGGRRDALGTAVRVAGVSYTIVGVLAADFHFGSQTADVMRPMVPGLPTEPAPGDFVEVVIRLREGATPDRLAAELGGILNRADGRDTRGTFVVLTESIRSRLYGWATAAFGPFAGVAALLLLLVSANVANLTLGRASGRRQEMALRTALGAGRGRLVRLVAIEAGLLTLASWVLGLLLSWWTINMLVRFNPLSLGGTHPVLDLRAVACASAVAVITGALAALWPGLTVLRREGSSALRQGPQHGTDSPRQRVSQRALVMCQIACALVVLTGAGLLTKTVFRMQSYDPGVDTHQLLTAYVDLSKSVADDRGSDLMANRVLNELRTIPGVTSAALASAVALSRELLTVQSATGIVRPATVTSTDLVVQVSTEYFETLGVPVLQGRLFAGDEFGSVATVALVNEEAVRRWWAAPGDVIGSRLRLGAPDSSAPWATVIGVVQDSRPLTVESLKWDAAARVFLPLAATGEAMTLYARTVGDPLAVLPSLHARTLALDRRVRIQMPVDANAQLEWEVNQHRVTATFVGGLAAFGLLLAAMGIYGVTTYAVGRRVREIGIRKALGARTGHVVLTVSRETAGLALGGIVIGLATSAAVTRALDARLYGTSPLDASVFVAAALLVVGIVALATWVPMRTALRVDPMTTLRCE